MKKCEVLFELLDEVEISEKSARDIIISKIISLLVSYVDKLDVEMQNLQNPINLMGLEVEILSDKAEKKNLEIIKLKLKNKLRILEYMITKLKNVINTESDRDPGLLEYVENLKATIELLKKLNMCDEETKK